MNVYDECPEFENDRFLIRFVEEKDVRDLLEVYSDKNALPFFNSDNCDGDNFYYPDEEKMAQAITFWLRSYKTRWFVRWTVFDKYTARAIGTVEMFHRKSDDVFNDMGVLRLDLRSDYEKSEIIYEILKLFVPSAFEMFDCSEIISKIPNYAIERTLAAEKLGFKKSEFLMVGTHDHYAYNGYWTIKSSDVR